MKKVFLYILVLVVLLVTSCDSNLLDSSSYSEVASETMWTTDNLTDMGVSGVYAALRLGMATSMDGFELYEMDRLGYTGLTKYTDAFLVGTLTASDSYFSKYWKYFYEGIQRTNDAIQNIPLKSPSDEGKKARYVAECKFLRAYFYYRLNQVWKGVPVYLEPFSADEATKARSSEAQVWQAIIDDLTDCIDEGNLPNKYEAGNDDYGHVTKGAAYALRGKVYMYTKNYDAAVADFQKVKTCGYSLFSNYKTLFKEANEQCAEMIFSMQNIGVSGYGSTTQKICGTRSSFGSCWNCVLISPNLVDLYENIDGSPFNWSEVIPEWSNLTAPEREVFFLRDNLTAGEILAAKSRGANMDYYLPNGNEERILKAYENRDPRLSCNVITPYSTYLGAYNGSDYTVTSRWPYRSAGTYGDLQTNTTSNFYYLYRKFVYEGVSETPWRDYGPIDFPIIRYAEVLLMWAEALNELGKSDEAIALVNQVRERAGVALLNSSEATTIAGQDDLRERIQDESRREFPNEGIDYYNELRWGTWKGKVFYDGNGLKECWGENVYSYSYQGDYITSWPIPQTELEINSNLKQNDGWSN
ncbi:MAG: RagB/SusD family nutrient uptake outer membrane protein [Mangrovibacterium sp.]